MDYLDMLLLVKYGPLMYYRAPRQEIPRWRKIPKVLFCSDVLWQNRYIGALVAVQNGGLYLISMYWTSLEPFPWPILYVSLHCHNQKQNQSWQHLVSTTPNSTCFRLWGFSDSSAAWDTFGNYQTPVREQSGSERDIMSHYQPFC